MSVKRDSISIIVPTLNEAENLPLLFRRIDKALTKAAIPYEIIVVDDRSSDTTFEVASAAARSYNVTVVTKEGKRGKAFSLLQGFALAQYQIVCMIDADLQYPPEAIVTMYHDLHKRNVDVVITERVDEKTSALRRLSSKVFNIIFAKFLFGLNYDTQSGLKMFRKQVIENITIAPSPWSFDLEFIVRSLEAGYTISNQKISFAERSHGQPKISVFKATFELAFASIRLRRMTEAKQLKHNYKRNIEYLRMPMILFVGLGIILLSSFVRTPKASALTLSSTLSPLTSSITIQPATIGTGVTNLVSGTPSSVSSGSSSDTGSGSAATTPASTTSTPAGPTTTDTASTQNSAATPTVAVADQTLSTTATTTPLEPAQASSKTGAMDTLYATTSETEQEAARLKPLARYSLIIGTVLVIVSGMSLLAHALVRRQHAPSHRVHHARR
jgi:glycosyltransferase involved in cell wall biosynthesis